MGFTVPDMEAIPDAFTPEGVADGAVILQENIFFTHHKNDLHRFHLADEAFVVEVGDELPGHIVIDILVPVAFEEVSEIFHRGSEVIAAAESDHFMEEAGIFESEIGRVVSAQAASGGDGCGAGVFDPDEIHHFEEDILFVLQVPGIRSAGCNVLE